MAGLHGRDDAEFGESGNIVGVDDLGVLDTEAMFGDRRLLEGLLEFIQGGAIRAVADGVHVDLETGLERLRRDLVDAAGRDDDQAGISGVIS